MDYEKISKSISYILRHKAIEYDLIVDEFGWVELKELISILNLINTEKITENEIKHIIKTSDKKRFEIVNDKIRALYGHSLKKKIKKDKSKPPEYLFHGTSNKAINNIFKFGLKPMQRQYVHLTTNINEAYEVGLRYDTKPVILKINSLAAWNDGADFYIGKDKVWLSNYIDSKYIEILNINNFKNKE